MIYPITLSDLSPRFQGHGVIFMPIDDLSVFCAQLTRDLLAIAMFLLILQINRRTFVFVVCFQLCLGGVAFNERIQLDNTLLFERSLVDL